jgi:hypothetical protein
MPHFRNMTRTLCRVAVSAGHGIGGFMSYVPLSPVPAKAHALRRSIAEAASPLVERPGTLAVHLLAGDDEASRIQTKEKDLRGSSDSVADWLLLVEGYSAQAPALATGPLGGEELLGMGAASVGAVSSYRLGALLAKDDVK